MTDQSSNQPTDANSTADSQGANVENWKVDHLPYIEDYQGFGFLQMCADRRFHKLLQQEFKKDAGLSEREDYWIHADAGGTPKMADQVIAPNYCYHDKKVRLMGWSAHGAGCGGFGEQVPDNVIRQALRDTMGPKIREYREATHFIYFVTIENDKTVVYRMIIKPGDIAFCEEP